MLTDRPRALLEADRSQHIFERRPQLREIGAAGYENKVPQRTVVIESDDPIVLTLAAVRGGIDRFDILASEVVYAKRTDPPWPQTRIVAGQFAIQNMPRFIIRVMDV